MTSSFFRSLTALCLLLSAPRALPADPATPELLLYCGITMIRPMTEICQVIEKEKNCKIHITKGGSGELLSSIRVNKSGDLFLPGSANYIDDCKKENLISQSALVGSNQAALFCQKGNPKNIPLTLESLADPKYFVILSDPDSGSIGKESKKILDSAKLWDPVIANTQELTTDSKRLTQVLKDKIADLTINWRATATWEENAPFVDAHPIPSAPQDKLILAILKTSQYPDIAQAVLDFASSPAGQSIFQKHGLSPDWNLPAK